MLNRLIPWMIPITLYVLLQNILDEPKKIYIMTAISLVVVVVSVWYVTGHRLRNEKFWRLVITPVFYLASSVLFLSFLESAWLKEFFLILIAFVTGVYLEVLYLWFHARPKYQAHSLENISTHINLLTVFFIATGFYSLITFFGVSVWYLLLGFAIISLLLTYELVWTSNASPRSGWAFVLVITLVVSQIFFVVSFLPSSIYVNGILITLSYYIMSGLSRNWLIDVKGKQVLKRYIIVSVSVLVLVLLTAKWF